MCDIFWIYVKNSRKAWLLSWHIDSYMCIRARFQPDICEISWNSSPLFSRELAFRRCEKRRRKISSAHRFREIRGKGKTGKKRFGSSGEFLCSPYMTLGSTGSDKGDSSVCLPRYRSFRNFGGNFFRLEFPCGTHDDREQLSARIPQINTIKGKWYYRVCWSN